MATYHITNWTQLAAMSGDLAGIYYLDNDLDENTVGYVGIGDDWSFIIA